MDSFPTSETFFLLPGPAGQLDVLTTDTDTAPRGVAIISHPHPLFSGTMQNKVVTTLAHTFQGLGLRTVRFNFRGVGKSTGKYAEGKGETDDLLTVIEWAKATSPNLPIWLAGFSFGAYVSVCAAAKVEPAKLITVAPPVSRFHFSHWPVITCPWIIVQGEKDEIVPPADVFAWYETLHPKPVMIRMPGAGHFFHGQLLELRRLLEEALTVLK